MRVVVIIYFLLIFGVSHAQIEIQQAAKKTVVGKVKSGSSLVAELSFTCDGTDTTYYLLFNNAEYKTLDDFQTLIFAEEGGVAVKLHEVLKSFFSEENKKNKNYKVSLKLGETQVTLMNFRVMGITSVMIHSKNGYFTLTEKQVDRLFNK